MDPDALLTSHRSERLFSRVLRSTDAARYQFAKWRQFRLAMCRAAQLGQLWMVQQLYERHPKALNGATALAAAQCGELPLIQWVHDTKRHLLRVDYYAAVFKAFEVAAVRGDLNTVQWLVETFPSVVLDIGVLVREGQLQAVQWLRDHATYQCKTGATDAVAKRGDLEMMAFLMENELLDESSCAMDLCAEFGHLEMKVGCSTDAMDLAAEFSHLHVLQWLHENSPERCTEKAMDRAAMNGHLEVLRWLDEHENAGCTTAAMDLAARMNHLDVVQWLQDNRSEGCTTQAMDGAAKAGHLGMGAPTWRWIKLQQMGIWKS
uniref:Uncharacterized protein n=1 Tax=Phytophthora ramorum TaxID=164328 RepID=H3HCI6_PHYRM